MRIPLSNGNIADVNYVVGYDFMKRILLTCFLADDATNGACITTIKGYSPNPVPARVTSPLPLSTPKKGEIVQIVSRAYGESGEPIAGLVGTWDIGGSTDATISPAVSMNNGAGYFSTLATGVNTASITATLTVDA